MNFIFKVEAAGFSGTFFISAGLDMLFYGFGFSFSKCACYSVPSPVLEFHDTSCIIWRVSRATDSALALHHHSTVVKPVIEVLRFFI
jgi:hypothetical protein